MKKTVNERGEIVALRKGLARTGKVTLPATQTWLKQPNPATNMICNYNLQDYRCFVTIIEALQGSMNERLRDIQIKQLTIFQTPGVNTNTTVSIQIPLKKFCIENKNYNEVYKSLARLAVTPVYFRLQNPKTGDEYTSVGGMFRTYLPDKYNRNIIVEMFSNVAAILVDVLTHGYTRYVKEIIYSKNITSKYTVRIYWLLCRWADKGGFEIKLSTLKKMLNLEEKYSRYRTFYDNVIKPAYKDLFEKSHVWFELSEIYAEDDKESPKTLRFKIIKAAKTPQDEEYINTRRKSISDMLFKHYNMNKEQIDEILECIKEKSDVDIIISKILSLKGYIEDKKIADKAEYAKKSIIAELYPEEKTR